MFKIKYLTLIVLFFIKISLSQSTVDSIDSKDNHILKKNYSSVCNYAEIAHYVPLKVSTSKDLPKKISCKLKRYLKKRVGKKLAKNFHIVGGRIIDLDKLKKVNKNWINSKTSYELCFSYINLEAGINAYVSIIKLDKNGKVLEDIKFPTVNKNSKFEKLVPFEGIKRRAEKKEGAFIKKIIIEKGKYVKYKTEVKMNYDEDNNILIWEFFNKTQKVDNTMLYEKYIFNAHNGEFIKIEKSEGVWIS